MAFLDVLNKKRKRRKKRRTPGELIFVSKCSIINKREIGKNCYMQLWQKKDQSQNDNGPFSLHLF